MSLEQSPSGGQSLDELTRLCEQAYSEEDWEHVEDEFDYTQLASFRLCKELRQAFELRYQLLRQPNAAHSTEKPEYLSQIHLHNPYISIPEGAVGGTDVRLVIEGNPLVEYLDILLHAGIDAEGKPYTGPHLVGVIDTEILEDSALDYLGITSGEYTFVTPVKSLAVSDRHVPHTLN